MILDRSTYRGIYVIVVTPFTDALGLDEAGLRATVRFCLDAGVHGLVSPANASEVGYLSDAERRRVAEIVVEEAAGRVPVVVGVSSAHARLSAAFAAHAEAIGAEEGAAVVALLAEHGFADIGVVADLVGHDRVVTGVRR